MTLHLTLKMTTAQVAKDYPHPDDHTKEINHTKLLVILSSLAFTPANDNLLITTKIVAGVKKLCS